MPACRPSLLPLSPKKASLHKTFTLRAAGRGTLVRLLQAAITCFCPLGGGCDSVKASEAQQNGAPRHLLDQTQS